MKTDDFMFDQEVRNAWTRATYTTESIEIREKREIAPDLFIVSLTIRQYYSADCLVIGNGRELSLIIPSQVIIEMTIKPMLESYTREHPWIAGA